MIELLVFASMALGAVWLKGKADQFATTSAVLLAWVGVSSYGWQGLQWDWTQAGWYLGLATTLITGFSLVFRQRLRPPEKKPVLDYVALVGWGGVQQMVLLSWLALINPWLAVGVFAVVHWPNVPLVSATLLGGGAAVAISVWFGEPCIWAAGAAHALASFWIRDVLDLPMGVGRGYDYDSSLSATSTGQGR